MGWIGILQSAEAYVHVAEHESQQTCVAAANRHGELVLRTKKPAESQGGAWMRSSHAAGS